MRSGNEEYEAAMERLLHPERVPAEPEDDAPVPRMSQALQSAFQSERQRKLIAEGKLRPLDHAKWEAGGYGPDPFGIAARASLPAPSPSQEILA